MAKNQNIRDQQELNRLTREYETMLNRVNSLRARIGQNPIRLLSPEETGNIRNLTAAIKTLADESSALNEQLSEAKKSFQGLNDEIKEFGEHLQKQNKGIEELVNSFKVVAEEVKTVTKDLSKIEVPSLTQRIGFEIEALPEIVLPDLKQKISFTVEDVPETTLPELQQNISYALGTLPTTDLPNLEQKVNFVLGDIPTVNLADIQQRVNVTVGEVPEISTPIDKIVNIVVKGVEEAEAIFKKLAEPFSKTVSVEEEVKRTAQEIQTLPPIQQSVAVRIDDSYIKPIADSLGKTVEEVKRAFAEASVGSRNLLSSAIDVQGAYNAIRGSLEEVGTARDKTLNRSLKSMRAIEKVSSALALDAEGTYKLSLKELQQKQRDFDLARETLKLEKNKLELVARSMTASEADKARANEALAFIEDEVKGIEDISRYNAARIKQENEINQLMGAGGALIKGASTLMNKLGISSQVFGDGLERAEEKMRETAEQIQSGARAGGRLTVLMSGLGGLASSFGTALTDPLTVITAILDGFLDVNKAAVELQRLTGTNESAAAGVNSRLITSVEYLQTAAELTKEIGLAANAIFDSTQLAALSEAQKLLGLSAEQTANLGMRAKFVGDTVDGFQDSILAGANAANRMGKSAVAPGLVLQDVLNTSEDISLSLGQNPKALGKAAVAARAFGLSLEQVSNIADGLLDFESSIGAELEAQLLTGRNIQLSRARELALVNDLEGLSKELANQGIRAADFANMNRIQQESVAKALGMSRDQLAKSLVAQAAQGELTEDQRAAVLGVTREQLAQLDIQKKLQDSLAKLAQAFSPMLDILIPFVELVGSILTPIAKAVGFVFNFLDGLKGAGEEASNIRDFLVDIVKLLTGGAIIGGLSLLKKGFSTARASGTGFLKSLRSEIANLKTPFKSLTGWITGAGKTAAETGSKVADAAASTAPKPSLKPPAPTTAAPGGGVAQTVSRVNATALLKGAAAMAIAAGGIYIFAKAVQELAKVEDYGKVAIGLGLFVGSMAAAALVLSLATPAFLTATPILLGFGAALVLAGAAFALASLGFKALGNLLDKLSIDKVGNLLLLGPALSSLAAGLVAMSIGGILGLAGVGVLANIAKLAPGLNTSASAISLMAREVVNLSNALRQISPESTQSLKNLLDEGIEMNIANLAPGLNTSASAISSMATEVSKLNTALKEITPESVENLKNLVEEGMEINAGSAIANVSEPIQRLVNILGGDTNSENADQGKLVAKLDELIRVVKEGGNVYMDGQRVGQALVLGSSKLA